MQRTRPDNLPYADFPWPPTEDELPSSDGIPMETERHVLQMNLLNQDFYVFQHETTHEVCVVYRRKEDGQYGLIGVHNTPNGG